MSSLDFHSLEEISNIAFQQEIVCKYNGHEIRKCFNFVLFFLFGLLSFQKRQQIKQLFCLHYSYFVKDEKTTNSIYHTNLSRNYLLSRKSFTQSATSKCQIYHLICLNQIKKTLADTVLYIIFELKYNIHFFGFNSETLKNRHIFTLLVNKIDCFRSEKRQG